MVKGRETMTLIPIFKNKMAKRKKSGGLGKALKDCKGKKGDKWKSCLRKHGIKKK